MANHKQAAKRHRQSLVRKSRNRHYKSMLRTELKRARQAVEERSDDMNAAVEKAVQIIDRVASKGIIPRNSASRTIGRLRKSHHLAQS